MHEQGSLQQDEDFNELQKALALHYALRDLPRRRRGVYHAHYTQQAVIAFGAGDYSRFRRLYHFTKAYGRTGLMLKLKYLLSCFPKLATALNTISRRLKGSRA